MDKELLRIVIIASGLIIIVGMLLWGYFRSQRINREKGFFQEVEEAIKAKLAPKPKTFDNEADRFDFTGEDLEDETDTYAQKHPRGKHKAGGNVLNDEPSSAQRSKSEVESNSAAKKPLPRLIQLSIIAKSEPGFNGADLHEHFDLVGLEYGSMMVYERLDINRMVDFAVASMVNPGTFPDEAIDNFYTPGITFFMQPQELPDPVLVFDDLIRTVNLLAHELEGTKCDAEHKPLTDATVKALRKSLQ